MERTTITLLEWLQQPPTIVIYRPDGQLSLDQLPGMNKPDAVVCFRSMKAALDFLGRAGRWVQPRRFEGFHAVELPLGQWLEAMKGEAKRGRTHLAVFDVPGDGRLTKESMLIANVIDAVEFAKGCIEEVRQADENWRWN